MRKVFLFLLYIFLAPLFAESFVDGESFTDGSSFTDGESFVGRESFVFGSSFTDGESFTDGKGQKIGVYESVVESVQSNIYANTTESIYEDVYDDIYVNGYGKYLKLVTAKGVNAQENFVKYFSDWQWSGQNQDFFSYAESRAEQEKQLKLCYNKVIAEFGIGTALFVVQRIVTIIVPGGQVYNVGLIIAKPVLQGIALETTSLALSGGAIGAVSSAGIAYLQGKRGDELIYETVKGAADGYLVGAVTGLISSSVKAYELAKSAQTIGESYIIFANSVYDSSSKLLLDASQLEKEGTEKLVEVLQNQGDDALKALTKVANNNPKNLPSALDWISAKGKNGTYDVINWEGKIPDWLTKDVIETAKKVSNSAIKATSDELLKLPSLKLSESELDRIRQNPEVLKEVVAKYTGKSFYDGYLEFFVRLSKQNPNQVERIWNSSRAVRDIIKTKGIRAGGVHEWLMCENFCDFLTDPKWRKDGAYLCELLQNLTQPTKSVAMENVTITLKNGTKEFYPIWDHLIESQKTFGNVYNPRSVIHKLIRDTVSQSNNAEELIVNLDKMVKNNFSEETYAEFTKALAASLK